MKCLKNHPFAVDAFFENSLVLTFATPKEHLQPLIPKCLQLDTFKDKWAFIAIAMVQTKGLRPKGLPTFLGNNFFLIGYRIFVRYTNSKGKNLRGLYILKSETDKKKMAFFGNLFTHYNYTTTDIHRTENQKVLTISSLKSNFSVKVKQRNNNISIPEDSPFTNWKEARKFAGPLPHTFTVNEKDKTILTILGRRQFWKPQPVAISHFQFEFLDRLNIPNIVLANAFEIQNIPYSWDKGNVEKWN